MVSDSFIDLQETGHLWMTAWRCMNCGYVVDQVAEQNRRLQAAGRTERTTLSTQPDVLATAPVVSSRQAA
jgi:hypothetical protein